MKLPLRRVEWVLAVAMAILAAQVASGQSYPNKPIRLVTGSAGGGGDFASRLIAPGLSGFLDQQVIVDNRAIFGPDIVAKAAPDGYTLLLGAGTFTLGPLLQKTAYDPVKDFSPITLAASAPAILVVHPSLPVKSVKELIALARAKPGELNYASAGTGATSHLAAELFNSMAGVNIVRIPYKGNAPALVAVIGGEVKVAFPAAGSAAPHVKSGRLRALAVTTAAPSALAPGLPTVAAAGLPGYESASDYGIFAPAKTPSVIIDQLNKEIVRVVSRADVKEKFLESGVEAVGSSPQQFAAAVKSEIARMGKVIKDAGIRVE